MLGSCTIKEALTAKNTTATLCGQPVRDDTVVTPVVTAVSGGLALIAVAMRIVDMLPDWTTLQPGDAFAIISLVSNKSIRRKSATTDSL